MLLAVDLLEPLLMPMDIAPASPSGQCSDGVPTTEVVFAESSVAEPLPDHAWVPGGSREAVGETIELGDMDTKNFSDLELCNAEDFPYCMNVKLTCNFPNDAPDEFWEGSGVLIDPSHVLTAGHCVYNPDEGGYAIPDSIKVMPGYHWESDGVSEWEVTPYGTAGVAAGSDIHVQPRWLSDQDHDYDIAVLDLDRPIGALTSWFGYGYNNSPSFYTDNTFHNAGYPAEDPYDGKSLYYRYGTFDSTESVLGVWYGNEVRIDKYSWGGQSGSGAYRIGVDDRIVYAVLSHTFMDSHTDFVRITSDFFSDINGYIAADTPSSLDLIPLDVQVSPEEAHAGLPLSSTSYLVHNYSSDSWSGTVNARVFLSQDEDISAIDDVLIRSHSFSASFSPKSSVRVNCTTPITIPADFPTGKAWIGVILDISDYDTGNNIAEGQDAAAIQVVNDWPEISLLPDEELDEDASRDDVTDLWVYASDYEDTDSQLSFSIVGNTDTDCGVSIDQDRYIDINPTADWYGYSDVTVMVEDRNGGWATDTFRITVNSVNDPPVISSLADDPDPVTKPDTVRLSAHGVDDPADPAGWVASVSFYRETNDTPGLQVPGDELVGTDNSLGRWWTEFSTASLPAGTYTYYAQATDNDGSTSPAGTSAPSTQNTVLPATSVQGVVYHDLDADGEQDGEEPGLEGWVVYLDENDNDRLDVAGAVEPDDYADGTVLNTVFPLATLSAVGSDVTSDQVTAVSVSPLPFASTGTMGFANDRFGGGSGPWSEGGAELHVAFAAGVGTVSIDFIGDDDYGTDVGRLEAYDRDGNLLDTYTTASLTRGNFETMTVSSASPEIAQVRAFGVGDAGRLDNLVFGTGSCEWFAVTDDTGAYAINDMPNGDYTVREVKRRGWMLTAPPSGEHEVTIDDADPYATGVDFGNTELAEINGMKFYDVNGNAVRDLGEPGLPGWTIYLDLNENGWLDDGEPSTVTNADGVYGFSELEKGTYVVAEVPQPDWEQTYPGRLYYIYDQQVVNPHLISVTPAGYIADFPTVGPQMGGLAYYPDTATLYGIQLAGPQLYEFDLSTGAALPLGLVLSGGGNGLAYNPLDNFLYTVNPNGELVQIDPLVPGADRVVSGPGPGVGAHAMAYNPDDQRIYVYWDGPPGVVKVYSYDAATFAGPTYHTPAHGLTGILGMAHNGETLVLSDGPADDQNIYAYDPATGEVKPLLTTDRLDAREVAAMTFAPSDGTHVVTLDYGDRAGMVDFGNRKATGEIHGTKWEDVDADGIRDGEMFAGDDADVVLVIDVSSSCASPFVGSEVGDVNGDGIRDSILDAELAALVALNDTLSDTSAEMAVVIFGAIGVQMDMDPSTPGVQLRTTPSADNDLSGVSDVEEVLLSIREGGYVGAPGSAGLSTNYESALQAAIDTFTSLATAYGDGTMIFVSDGFPGSGVFEDEVADLEAMGVELLAYGAGETSSLTELLKIDGDAEIFTSSGELLASIADRVITYTEPGLPDWTIFLDMNGNGLFDAEARTSDSGPVALTVPDTGTVRHTLTVDKMNGHVMDVNVTLTIVHPSVSELVVSLISPNGTRIELIRDVAGSIGFLGTTLDDEAAESIQAATSPFFGAYRPVDPLANFDGESPNGDWTLELTDVVGSGLTGTLGTWSLWIEAAEPITTTDADGYYEFTDLPLDLYEATELMQPGWSQTYPGEPDPTHVVRLYRTAVVGGVDFGNVPVGPWANVVGRHLFYNNSFWDTPTAENPDFDDDMAIAPDKQALTPADGQATFDHYTSYCHGINGIMVDIAGLPAAEEPIDPADYFTFKTGNDDNPASWDPYLVAPTITIRPGEGADGSDRITLAWPDYDPQNPETTAVANAWLEVTVLANAYTGLAAPNVFYFGNAIAEMGDSDIDARVDANDILQTRNHPHPFFDPADIYCVYDFNRDQRVDAHDLLIARNNQTTYFNDLELIDLSGGKGLELPAVGKGLGVPAVVLHSRSGSERIDRASAHDAALEQAVRRESIGTTAAAGKMDWLWEFDLPGGRQQPVKRDLSLAAAAEVSAMLQE